MTMMQGFLAWIVVGALTGWLFYLTSRSGTLQDNITVGVFGAGLWGILFTKVVSPETFNIWSLFPAFIGAILLLCVWRMTINRVKFPLDDHTSFINVNVRVTPKTQAEIMASYYLAIILAAQTYEKYLLGVVDSANKDIAATWNNPYVQPPTIDNNTKTVMDELTRVHYFVANVIREYDNFVVNGIAPSDTETEANERHE